MIKILNNLKLKFVEFKDGLTTEEYTAWQIFRTLRNSIWMLIGYFLYKYVIL